MHPKVPKPTYSIILMRDDCDVSAFRLNSLWIKLFIIFLIVLMAACAAGAYGTFYYENRYRVVAAKNKTNESQAKVLEAKLSKYENESRLGYHLADSGKGGASQINAQANSGQAARPGSAQTQARNESAPVTQGQGPATGTSRPSSGQTSATPADMGQLLSSGTGALNPVEVDALMEDHPIRISNLKTSFDNNRLIKLNYEIKNQRSGITIVGKCHIALITRTRGIIDVTPGNSILSFQIARFRNMEVTVRMPDGVKKEDIIGIQVSAKAKDLPLYYKQFAL